MNIINIAAYKFVTLTENDLPKLRIALREEAMQCNLKGTILLSLEGINLILAGLHDDIEAYKAYLESFESFQGLVYKESVSDYKPFTRMLVRVKKEIISMGREEIKPEHETAPRISPEEFKRWYEEKRDMVVLDTRNDYEVALGTFDEAIDLNLETFRGFPDAVDLLPAWMKEKPIVTFCTGGVRCEKGAELMRKKGFKNVYQLDGGILSYFEKCGGEHYHGECFVFDHRVAVDTKLNETATTQCYACRSPLTVEEQTSKICPYCQHIRDSRKPRHEQSISESK
ncbi:rhodanese-related sulfurtransferase [Candidiatus Paracoxiella cheracis]|uniref:oxygen-dependent tRNA uridine(34) hydroxylase TrhO n=1 Tax=Candidiatus Paracoxiella cheracis TaxID=3405120 RepID=UPI003BF463F3